ncbi:MULTISPECIES: class I SAM-dependent methyltransferase [Streptomyces]|uniref:class I SAM-dependent methyltransferase n=1 Tax=Streptomyces TaxID=1883 RepID=UPI00367D2F1F
MTSRFSEPAPATGPGEALFGTAAADYSRYRPGIPDAAVCLLAATLHGVSAPALLDLGTGTGQVPRALLPALPRLARIDLVDVNPAMLDQAMSDLQPLLGGRTATAFTGPAHTFTPQHADDRADLITCCRAFHWMDRPAVLEMADRVAAPNGVVAVMGDGSLWTHTADWTTSLRELIQTYLGEPRRAGATGTYTQPARSYEDDLAGSPFSDVHEHRFPVTRAWRVESVIGYLRSTSFARPDHFADRRQEFEAEARHLLAAHAKGGILREDAVFTVLTARRPGCAS